MCYNGTVNKYTERDLPENGRVFLSVIGNRKDHRLQKGQGMDKKQQETVNRLLQAAEGLTLDQIRGVSTEKLDFIVLSLIGEKTEIYVHAQCPVRMTDGGKALLAINDLYLPREGVTEEQLEQALQELELRAEKDRCEEPEAFTDNVIMYEVLSELKDIAARGGISCSCGCKDYSIAVHRGAVDLICKDCGGRLRLPAATDEDLDRLCCQMKVVIHKM